MSLFIFRDLERKVKVTVKVKLANSATAGPIKFIFRVLVPLGISLHIAYFVDLEVKFKVTVKVKLANSTTAGLI